MLPPYGPVGSGSVASVSGTAPIHVVNGAIAPVVSLDALGVTAAKIAADAVTTLKILNDAVITAKLATDAVTAAKLDPASLRFVTWQGRNGAGACTCTGVKVGDKRPPVLGTVNVGGAPVDITTSFEATITVADQVQQTAVGDLSMAYMLGILVAKGG